MSKDFLSHPLVTLVTMQMHFLFTGETTNVDWRLDEPTKLVGKEGIAHARATLEAARRRAEGQSQAA